MINLAYFIDKKLSKLNKYDYETAPYCGYHYNGVEGYFYNSSYHEGEGGESARFLGFEFHRSTDNDYWWGYKSKIKLVLMTFIKNKHNNELKFLSSEKVGFKDLKKVIKRLRTNQKHGKAFNFKYKLRLKRK